MSKHIGIVGAGVMGLWQAFSCLQKGYRVTVFEQNTPTWKNACSYYAGGMLAPFCELESAEPWITQVGMHSMICLQRGLPQLPRPVWFQQTGSLVVAHAKDQGELERMTQRVQRSFLPHDMKECNLAEMQTLEPDLEDRFHKGLFFPHEGQIHPRELLPALLAFLEQAQATVHFETPVDKILPHTIEAQGKSHEFDTVIDCRGLFAKQDIPGLRGVKGEMILVQTKDITLHRPVRMMHPRYPIYIVPRPDHVFMIGATSLENESRHQTSVRSVLELLSAAYALHPAFGEATVLELNADARPALPHHLPCVEYKPGLLRINGLYRHGILLSPALADLVGCFLSDGTIHPWLQEIWRDLP